MAAKKKPSSPKNPTNDAPRERDVGRILAALDTAIATYAPRRRSSFTPAPPAEIAALGAVPAALAALWSWANGATQLLFPGALTERAAWTLLSAADATRWKRELEGLLPAGHIPFAEDESGNMLLVREDGQVVDWDHESHELEPRAGSVEALLERTLDALEQGVLFGGREQTDDEQTRALAKLEAQVMKKLAGPQGDAWRKAEADVTRAAQKARRQPVAGFHRLFTVLRERFEAAGLALGGAAHAQRALTAMEAGAFAEALASMRQGGFDWRRQYFDYFSQLGERALQAGDVDTARAAFAASDSPMALVGRVFLDPADATARAAAEAALAPHLATGAPSGDAGVRFFVLAAALAARTGDAVAGRRLFDAARACDAAATERALAEMAYPKIAGLV